MKENNIARRRVRTSSKKVSRDIDESTVSDIKVDPSVVEEVREVEETQPLTIGSYLKKHRELKHLSISAMSRQTKISATNLECLESNNFSELPNKTYVAGYIKSYAKLVGLDKETCLDLFESTYGIKVRPAKDLDGSIGTAEKGGFPDLTEKHIYFGVAAILGLSVLYWIFGGGNDGTVEKPEGKKITPQSLTASTPLIEREGSIDVVKPQTSKLSVDNVEKVEVAEASPRPVEKEKVEPQEGEQKSELRPEMQEDTKKEEEAVKKIRFTPMNSVLYDVDSEIITERVNELLPANIREKITLGKQNLYIRAHSGDSWMTYKVDGGPIRKLVVRNGSGLYLKGDEIRVFIGNVGAVKVFLNNQPLRFMSKTSVRSLVVPQRNRTKYHIPLFIYHDSGKVETSQDYIERLGITP